MRRKLIKGIQYDIDSATEIAEISSPKDDQTDSFMERLYRKRSGEYFVYGVGGARTRYAKRDGASWTAGWDIIPQSYEDARKWAKSNLSWRRYQDLFGTVRESGETVVVTLHIDRSAKQLLAREASRSRRTMSGVAQNLIMENLNE